MTQLLVKENAGRVPSKAERSAGATYVTRDTVVRNNLLIATREGGTKTGLTAERWPCKAEPALLSVLDHNGYVSLPGASYRTLSKLMPDHGSCDRRERAVTAQSPGDAGKLWSSDVAGEVVSDPVRGAFTLPSGSAAAGAGTKLTARDAKLIGLAVGAAVPMGAPAEVVDGTAEAVTGAGGPATGGVLEPGSGSKAGPGPGPGAGTDDSSSTPGSSPGASAQDNDARPDGSSGLLASTGASLGALFGGIVLLGGGALLVMSSRRRRHVRRH
ncbi:hypothetical protein [Streptomyces sp. NPDC001661]